MPWRPAARSRAGLSAAEQRRELRPRQFLGEDKGPS